MYEEGVFLADVGINNLSFPIRVPSRADPEGQHTIAEVSAYAHIMKEFRPRWMNKFMQVLHRDRRALGVAGMRVILEDLMQELRANKVTIRFDYPFFMEKTTPVTRERCLVKYSCSLEGWITVTRDKPAVLFRMRIPVITSHPASVLGEPGGLLGQLTLVNVELQSDKPLYPEDVAELVESYAVSPVYSYLAEEDQEYIINKIHSVFKPSTILIDRVKDRLARNEDIEWYSVECRDYGIVNNYTILARVEKSRWIPFSSYIEETI